MRGSRYDQQRPGGEPFVIADPPLVESTSQRFLGVPLRRTEAEISESVSSWSPDWDDYRNAMIYLGRCLIRITPTKAGSTVFG
jgi:hypothetical protein